MKIACYDSEGNEVFKEPVDARECVEHCGFTMERPEVKEIKAKDDAKDIVAEDDKDKIKKKAGRPPKKDKD